MIFSLTLAIYVIHHINMFVCIKVAKQSAKSLLNANAKTFIPKPIEKWKNTTLNTLNNIEISFKNIDF